MITPNYEETIPYQKDYNLVPICKEIYADIITPIQLLRKLSLLDQHYYLLESVEGGERWGRYSFLGFCPLMHVTCREGEVTVESGELKLKKAGKPMEILRELLLDYKAPHMEGMPTFTGGFVGYFSYEMIGYAEPALKLTANDGYDMDLMLFDKVIAYDHLKQKIFVIANAKTKEKEQGYRRAVLEIDKLVHMLLKQGVPETRTVIKEPEFKCSLSEEQYCKMVEKTKEYIREGDIFQGVISRRLEASYTDSLFHMYRVLRTTNPSPYMYFIQSKDVQIAGASPETLIKIVDGRMTTFPVAGTRPRGKDEEEDRRLEAELLADEKELSEHNMLVDLARNDIGRVAAAGSVCVEEYMKIHRFSKVMHIASVVCGQIAKGKDGLDAVESLLPAGTLSGAPKFRACQIISELEPEARGIYGGAIGYLDFSGNLDVCIAIRTAVKRGNRVYVQAGAGIVADSVPKKEYEECANKAGAVLEAFRRAGEAAENDITG